MAWASHSTAANLDFSLRVSNHSRSPQRLGNCFGEDNQRTGKQTSSSKKDRTRLTAQLLNISIPQLLMKDKIELSAVEDHDGISTIRGGGARRDWNGIHYKQGMSSKNVGTTKLSANIATIPPGGVAYAHIHVDFEVILYIIEGKVRHEFGDGCKRVLENEAGDFIYIKPGVPHEVFNMSDTEPVVAFVARSSADEWDNIIPYDRNSPTPSS